ncbi:MAG: hypothetical protein CVT67_04955 [Actinobacteria bacterium HGW-Actinobacteria-7]|nr:MAG: hypothetical protein CVT67_04955 [Actinobacteria bacterium HGW-Actinobacteria-7]
MNYATKIAHSRYAEMRRRIVSSAVTLMLLANLVVPVVPAAAATPPIAKAGADRTVPSGTRVVLDGSASTVPSGYSPSYSWTQVGGPSVTLAGVNPNRPTVEFFAPLVASATELEFELTVGGGVDSGTDTVKVTVVPASLPSRLSLQPGRSGMQDIKTVGRTVYVAWCYRNGGALETWFARSLDGGANYETPRRLPNANDLGLAGGGDCQYPKIAVDGLNVYVAWRQYVRPSSSDPWGSRAMLATSRAGGSAHSWSLDMLGTGVVDSSEPELAATTDGENHNVFVLFQAAKSGGNPLVLATSRDAGSTFMETDIEANASDQPGDRALAAHGNYAYVAYPTADKIKLYSRSASTGAETRGSFSDLGGGFMQMAASPDGRLCVAWQTLASSRHYAYASVLTTSTMSGARTSLAFGEGMNQSAPEIAWTGESFMATWVDMPAGIDGGSEHVCIGRVRTGGGLTDQKQIYALSGHSNYLAGLATVAGTGGLVALGWWDEQAACALEAVSRDGGVTFGSAVNLGTWTGDSGGIRLASNGATDTPAVQAVWGGNLRYENGDVHCDLYTKRLAAIAENNLALEHLQVVQAPWDDSPTQRLAKDKKTTFRLDVANGYDEQVTTQVELRYTQVTGGAPAQTVMTKDVTLAPYDNKAVYFENVLLTGDSVSASATLNPDNSPSESERADNEAELSSRAIVETQKLDCLYVPVVLPGDKGPDTAAFYSAVGSWGRFIAETYPIDDQHWLSQSRPTFNWTPKLDGYTPGHDLTSDQYNDMEEQLVQLAQLTGHETVLGFVHPTWFKDHVEPKNKDAVGLAPFGMTKTHVGIEEVGQPAQIGGHEIAHTYGLIPPGTPGDMPGDNSGHFDRRVATGYSASRGEIGIGDPKSPTFDMMQYTAVANAWIGPVSYYLLMDYLKAGAPDPDVVLLTGEIDRAAMTGALDPAYRFDSEADVELGTVGDLQLVFKDGADAVLDSAGFNPSFTHTGAGLSGITQGDATSFSVKVPWVTGAEKIELVYEGTLIDTLLVSSNAPTVTLSSPTAGATYSVGETVTASWIGADTDGGTLSYLPMLSIDAGVSWAPLCGETTDTTCEFAATRQLVTEKARMKVIATDGVNSGEDLSGVFAIRPVVPTGTGGGGVPTWGPVLGFPAPPGSNGLDKTKWTIGASGDTVYAGWIDENDLWDPKDHLRVMKSTDRGTTWGPAVDMSGPMDLDGGSEDPIEMQVFTFEGETIYTLSFERIDSANRKLVFRKSTDGGASLETSTVVTTSKASPAYPNVQEPKMVVQGENIYVLANVVASASAMEIWLFKSTNGGTTWSAPTVVASGPWNGVGAIGQGQFCAQGDDVYVTCYRGDDAYPGDAAVMYSHDGGENFSAPEVVVHDVYYPSVAADGQNVHVAALYYNSSTSSGLKVASSGDYGATFGAATDSGLSAEVDSSIGGPRLLASGDKAAALWRGRVQVSPGVYRFPLYSMNSTDGGQTFATPIDLLADVTVNNSAPWGDTLYTKVRAQGDSLYVATQIYEHWQEGDSGQGNSKRLAVFTSTDFGGSWADPEVTSLDPPKEDTYEQTVLACTSGLVYAGAGVETYWTELTAFLRVGSTGSSPAVAAGEDLAVSEGQVASVTADFSAGDATGATATIEWGDGTTSDGACGGTGTTGTVEAAHAYGTYGTYDATVHLTAGGQSVADTFTVTVANVTPSVSVPGTSTTTVGLPWQSEGLSFSDAGWDDALTATIDWGDGTLAPATLRVTSPGGNGEAQAGSVDATHTYAAPGIYEALVTVDDGADETTATFAVNVELNNPPVADAGGPYTAYEGALVSLDASASTDPDGNALSFSWTLDGESVGSALMDNRTLSLRLADNGEREVAVGVDDGRGGRSVSAATLTVLNVAPSVEATTPRSVGLNGLLSITTTTLASFTDPGVLDTHTAVIEWGDGTTSPGVVDESSGSGDVLGSHTYALPGDYTVNVTVTDKDGGSGSAEFALTVTNTAPAITKVRRIDGRDRYRLALASSRSTFPANKSPRVVIASGERWDDALAASGLAGTFRSPVLLTRHGSLAPGLVTELRRLGAKSVYVVGNSSSVSSAVTTKLKLCGFSVTRISGANRYEVARNVAAKIEVFRGNNRVTKAFVVRADAFYDAQTVSALAYNLKVPILFSPRTTMSGNTERAIRELDIDEVIIAGDTAVVSSSVARALKRLPSVDAVTRWGGSTSAATAVVVANEALKRGWISYGFVGLVDQYSYVDGLSAASATGYRHGPILLLTRTSVPVGTHDLLVAHRSQIKSLWVFARVSTIVDATIAAVSGVVD